MRSYDIININVLTMSQIEKIEYRKANCEKKKKCSWQRRKCKSKIQRYATFSYFEKFD